MINFFWRIIAKVLARPAIADRIESHNSSPIWQRETQAEMAI